MLILEDEFILNINSFVGKIDSSINNFRFNVSIAYFYQVYKILKDCVDLEISKKILEENIIKIMKLMMPFTPHLTYECLELFNCKTYNDWPKIDKKNISNEIKIAVQINGKTREIITIKKDLNEKEINTIILKGSKARKYLENGKILKTIFVKNKIINYIVKNV